MIQIDMKMPEKCAECRFNSEHGYRSAMPVDFCGNTDDDGKPEWCPLQNCESVKPVYVGENTFECENCHITVGWEELEVYGVGKIKYKFCPGCGRKIQWD